MWDAASAAPCSSAGAPSLSNSTTLSRARSKGILRSSFAAGEAGVGKSRLVSELAGRIGATGALSLTGGCIEVGGAGLPYAPIAQALRGLSSRLDPEARRRIIGPNAVELGWLVPDLGPAVVGHGQDPPGAGRQAQLLDAVLATLGRASLEHPLLLVLEDLHWADGSTRDLLQFVIRNLRDERILLIGTYRSDDLHRRHPLRPFLAEMERSIRVERLDVHRFDLAELAEQVTGIIGEAPSAALVARLLDRSDGLPFYVEELMAGGEPTGSMSTTLREVLDQRLDSLSDSSLDVVRTAAVIGERFDHERLASIVDMEDSKLMAALRDAIETRIVETVAESTSVPRYAFRHALLREAAIDQLLPTERVRLHSRLADHLERSLGSTTSDDPSLIADYAIHAYHALDQPRALEASVRAVRALVAATAYPEALGHAERALELWPRVADAAARAGMDHAALLGLAARIAAAARAPARAVAFSQAALRELDGSGEPLRQAELYVELEMYAWEAEDLDTSAAAAHRAYDLVADSPASSLKANAAKALGSNRWWHGWMIESAVLLREAMSIAEQVNDEQVWAEASASLAHTLADAGQAERAAELVDRSAGVDLPIRRSARQYLGSDGQVHRPVDCRPVRGRPPHGFERPGSCDQIRLAGAGR